LTGGTVSTDWDGGFRAANFAIRICAIGLAIALAVLVFGPASAAPMSHGASLAKVVPGHDVIETHWRRRRGFYGAPFFYRPRYFRPRYVGRGYFYRPRYYRPYLAYAFRGPWRYRHRY
jgi:hypothetical protein